jgi:pre-60S factor REI1
MATAGVEPGMREQTGFYCSTSGTYFSDKESLSEHYKSDFHRYNLKRKVAGLPPVSREWFDARKAQLTSATTTPHQKIWYDPLTKRKFMSENTYRAHVNSKKYQDLVKQSGQPAPAPVITLKKLDAGERLEAGCNPWAV